MSKITVSVPDELLEKFRREHPEINPAEVVRSAIISKLEDLEKLEELKAKGKI